MNMYARFRLVPKSMILNDLWARFKVIDSLNAAKWRIFKTGSISESVEDRAKVTINGLYIVVHGLSIAAKMAYIESTVLNVFLDHNFVSGPHTLKPKNLKNLRTQKNSQPWSKHRQPPGAAQHTVWTEWTLAMTKSWWQHHMTLVLLLLLLFFFNLLLLLLFNVIITTGSKDPGVKNKS